MHWCLKSMLLYTVAFTFTFLRTTIVIRPVRIPNRVPTCTQTEVEQVCSSTARDARYRSSSCLISSAVFCDVQVSRLQGAKEETSTGRTEWKTANRETDNHQPMESRWWWGITSHTRTHTTVVQIDQSIKGTLCWLLGNMATGVNARTHVAT